MITRTGYPSHYAVLPPGGWNMPTIPIMEERRRQWKAIKDLKVRKADDPRRDLHAFRLYRR